MRNQVNRRDFLQMTAAGGVFYLAGVGSPSMAFGMQKSPRLISPGCRKSKVKVARIYMGTTHGLWPKPNLDLEKEVRFYESEFTKLKVELMDVDFVVDELVTTGEEAARLKDKLRDVDGILAIHFNIGINPMLNEILRSGKPTMVFAVPYSGHEWVGFGGLRKQELGAKMDCLLTSDYKQLATAIRPFRALHHLREAKILNVTTRSSGPYTEAVKNKFGTEIKRIDLKRMVNTYNSISDEEAQAEAQRWIKGAELVVEPSAEEIFKSCKMALACEKLLDEEQATVMTADCYGSMHQPLCREYAYPCIGFSRLNNLGLGGILRRFRRSRD